MHLFSNFNYCHKCADAAAVHPASQNMGKRTYIFLERMHFFLLSLTMYTNPQRTCQRPLMQPIKANYKAVEGERETEGRRDGRRERERQSVMAQTTFLTRRPATRLAHSTHPGRPRSAGAARRGLPCPFLLPFFAPSLHALNQVQILRCRACTGRTSLK